MLKRAKSIAAVIVAETTRPAALIGLSHNARAALADLAAELIELNQRIDLLERDLTCPAISAAEFAGKRKGERDDKG